MRNSFLILSQVRICRPPPLSFYPISMEDAQCADTNEKLIFRLFQFLFFELSWKFIENWCDLSTKMTMTRKITTGKIWNLIFLLIPPILHLSCEFEQLWRKKLELFFQKKLKGGRGTLHQKTSRCCIYYFGIGEP